MKVMSLPLKWSSVASVNPSAAKAVTVADASLTWATMEPSISASSRSAAVESPLIAVTFAVTWLVTSVTVATVCAAADPSPRDYVPSYCILGHTFHPALPEACDAWQVPNLGTRFREPPRSDVPVLMFSAELDTKTPMSQARRLLPYLDNARHVVLMNAGHDDLLEVTEEVRVRIDAFFTGEAVSAAPIVLEPIRFSKPSARDIPCARDDCSDSPVPTPFAARRP